VVPGALLPALALTAGAAAGIAFNTPWRVVLWLLPVLLGGASLAWCLRRSRVTCLMTTGAFACCALALASSARERSLDTPLRAALDGELHGFRVGAFQPVENNRPIRARLLLKEDASIEDNVATLRAQVLCIRPHDEWLPSAGGVVISIGGSASAARASQWRRGRVVEAPVTFRRPAQFLDAGVPDFEREAALDGISLLGTVKSALLVDVVRRGNALAEGAASVRAYTRHAVSEHVAPHSPLSAAIVTAVLIGDRSGLPDDVRSRLQIAGTYHVIAISGGNIAILAALLLVAFVPLGISGRRAAAVTLICLVAYAFVVTSGPSVWRATLVALVYLVARLLDHKTAPWQATAVAAALLSIGQPLDVRNAGFLLTFGATAALLAMIGRQGRERDRERTLRPRWLSWLMASIGASAAVEAMLLPVMAATFSRVTAAGLVLNVIAVPAMAVVQIAGLLVVATPIHAIAALAGWLAHFGAIAILDSARLVDVAPWLAIRVPPPSALTISIYYVALAVSVFSPIRTMKAAAFTALLVSGLAILKGPLTRSEISGMRLTMFDVGQGDALMLQIGAVRASGAEGQAEAANTIMVDTGGSPFGGSFDIGARVLEPALWARGLSGIDTLVLTHGDPDHIGGALPLIDDFEPRRVWQGIPVSRAASLQAVLQRAAGAGASLEQRHEGEEFRLGEARIHVLHPRPPEWERQKVRNDDSVVLEVMYGDVAFLLTGDIGADVERSILPRLVPAKIRVLKVAHHGSRTSTSRELLEAWRPQFALISCGRGNPFGHPVADVIARLQAIGARIYRTDLDGEITVDTDGKDVKVSTFVEDAMNEDHVRNVAHHKSQITNSPSPAPTAVPSHRASHR
jgi:competence protein ComEC